MEWKVFRTKCEVLPHPSADRLDLLRLDGYSCVVQKGLRQDGSIVIFVPEKSILPNTPLFESYRPYLTGSEKNRVKSIRLRGEPSMGIILEDQKEFEHVPLGEDISGLLGITKFEPCIPAELAGQVINPMIGGFHINRHDCEIAGVNLDEFEEDEEVFAFEKIHGSQCSFSIVPGQDGQDQILVSSKGLAGKGLFIAESETNSYWLGVKDINLAEKVRQLYPGKFVQVFGELIPVQFLKYGKVKPTVLLFRVEVDGVNLSYDEIPQPLKELWVPLAYRGPFNYTKLQEVAKGKERVSGKQLTISEGVVCSPVKNRMSKGKNPFPLYIKIINPKYAEKTEKEDLEAIS